MKAVAFIQQGSNTLFDPQMVGVFTALLAASIALVRETDLFDLPPNIIDVIPDVTLELDALFASLQHRAFRGDL